MLTATGNSNVVMGLVNSVIITAGSIVGLVLLGSLTGYVIARSTRRWSSGAYYLFLIAIILPGPARHRAALHRRPDHRTDRIRLGHDHPLHRACCCRCRSSSTPDFFRGLGTEYEEAATIDGATRTQIFFRIVLPLMSPRRPERSRSCAGLIVWNDFFTSLIFLGGSANQTLPVAMYYYIGSLVSPWNKIFAIVIVSMIPILALLPVRAEAVHPGLRRRTEGLTRDG